MIRIMMSISVALLPAIASVGALLLNAPDPQWTRVAQSTDFAPRDSASEFVFKDFLWLIGGWTVKSPHMLYDVWNSHNGKNWSLESEAAPFKYPDLTGSIVFKNEMWVLGGGGEPDWDKLATNQIWSSGNGKDWTQHKDAEWSPRNASAVVEFKGKL